ncbi:hypothetical protein ABT237_23010 [Streptomyces sp. NPDC001581]|uniref:hypothetical protein n=1 Tax=Streptomyces sp. NPDC001581 TaxID=3154386 RepID=UPI00332193F2
MTALTGLYTWAEAQELTSRNPVAMKEIIGRSGTVIQVPSGAKVKDAKLSNVKWLTPQAWSVMTPSEVLDKLGGGQ